MSHRSYNTSIFFFIILEAFAELGTRQFFLTFRQATVKLLITGIKYIVHTVPVPIKATYNVCPSESADTYVLNPKIDV